MKNLCAILLFLSIFGAFAGCSNRSENPISAQNINDENPLIVPSQNESPDAMLLGQWVMTFDLEKETVDITRDRNSNLHYNLTSFLPAPEIVINSINPTTQTVDVDITVTNPYPVTGYNLVLIIYTDSIGHKLLNADEWTDLFDIPGGMPINPFMAYAKQNPIRHFGPGEEYTENFVIKLPGMNPSVRFAIEASYPKYCSEPYWIYNFDHTVLFDIPTSISNVEVFIENMEGDLGPVYLYCPQISGSTFNSLTPFYNQCTGTIQNTRGAGVGKYFGYIIAYTTISGTQALYDEVTITVSKYGTPVEPQIISTFDTSTALGLDVVDNYLYLADGVEGLKIINVEDPANPWVEGIFDDGYWFYDVTVDGNHAYCASEARFCAVDVFDKDNPVMEFIYTTSSSPSRACIKGSYAYFTGGWFNTWIFDISDPENWIWLSSFPNSDWAYNADVQGDLMIVADAGDGVQLVDVEDRAHPALIKDIETSYAEDVLIDGGYAYVADDGDGIRVINNIGFPEAASIVHSVDLYGSANKLALQNNFLYVAYGADGIKIFDVSVPETAYLFSEFDTDGNCQDIVVRDKYAYIADNAQGITIAKLW